MPSTMAIWDMVLSLTSQRYSFCAARPPTNRFPFYALNELCVIKAIPGT